MSVESVSSPADVAKTITILPTDSVSGRIKKRDRGFVVEGDPENIRFGLEKRLQTRTPNQVRTDLLEPRNFRKLLLLTATNHPILETLGLAEEQPLRTALHAGAETILTTTREGYIHLSQAGRREKMERLGTAILVLQQFQEKIHPRPFLT